MSSDKTKLAQAKKRVSNSESRWEYPKTSKKYHYAPVKTKAINRSAPQSVSQKRAEAWYKESIAANKILAGTLIKDSEEYREYMDEQAERAGWIEDRQNGLFFLYSFFIFFMGYAWTLPQIRGSILVFILSSFGAYHSLQLRGGYSLTSRSKGDKR